MVRKFWFDQPADFRYKRKVLKGTYNVVQNFQPKYPSGKFAYHLQFFTILEVQLVLISFGKFVGGVVE